MTGSQLHSKALKLIRARAALKASLRMKAPYFVPTQESSDMTKVQP